MFFAKQPVTLRLLGVLCLIACLSSCFARNWSWSSQVSSDAGYAPETTQRRSSSSFDYIMLSTFWPKTVCLTTKSKCSIPSGVSDFTIHGLWPSFTSKNGPEFCDRTNTTYDFKSELGSLYNTLKKKYWPNYLNVSSPDSFWTHEMRKHGTCATDVYALRDVKNYFTETYAQFRTLNLYSKLSKAKITPSSRTTTTHTLISNALSSAFGYDVGVQCRKSSTSTVRYLYAINICYRATDNGTLQMRSCPSSVISRNKNSCGTGSVMYPPIDD